MKRGLAITLFLFFYMLSAKSQQLVINSVNTTTSICYNDGTLAINASGGVQPYQYAIISGPVLSNVNYPVAPDSGNLFLSVHAGTYVVQVTDNTGVQAFDTVVVSGNYQYPVLSVSVSYNVITVNPSLGAPPYKYAISTVGPNGPFGAYQSDNSFDSLCDGTYYVRVKDDCGNFYTTPGIDMYRPPPAMTAHCYNYGTYYQTYTSVQLFTGHPPFTYRWVNSAYDTTNSSGIFQIPLSITCPGTVYVTDVCNEVSYAAVDCNPIIPSFCSNFSDSSATISCTGGQPPYSYTLYESGTPFGWAPRLTQDSGHFVHIPYWSINDCIYIRVTDACGRLTGPPPSNEDCKMSVAHESDCPYVGHLTLVPLTGHSIGTDTITCVSCTPAYTLPPGQIEFTTLGTGEYIFRITDGCGETMLDTTYLPFEPMQVHVEYTACNAIKATPLNSNLIVIDSPTIFTIYILDNGSWNLVQQDTTGVFYGLANGSYRITTDNNVCSQGVNYFSVPLFASYCIYPYMDTLCQPMLLVNYEFPDFAESYSLTAPGGIVYNEVPIGPDNGSNFNIPPGIYTLVSDSGCSIAQTFNFYSNINVSHSASCLNEGSAYVYENGSFSDCLDNLNYLRYVLTSADTTIITETPGNYVGYYNLHPGAYHLEVYFDDTLILFNGNPVPNNNINCLLDSASFIIPEHTIPYLTASNIPVCGPSATGNIPFTITGGFPPYYVSITGQSNITTNNTTGVLPSVSTGSYTMILSDSCGISTSLSISVIDTCINCQVVQADFTTADSIACIGDTVSFLSSFIGNVNYTWTVNGTVFSSVPSPHLILDSAGNKMIRCIVSKYGCRDTFSLLLHSLQPLSFNLGNDVFYCDGFSMLLSSGISATSWSTGTIDSSIMVSSPGLYWGTLIGNCRVFSDSIKITQGFTPVFTIGTDSVLCNGDSALLSVQPPIANAAYLWSTGSVDSSITIKQADEYSVTVFSSGCSASDSLTFQNVSVDRDILIADTTLCQGDILVLTLRAGSNPVWQDGSQLDSYIVNGAGTYSVTVGSICGNIYDSVKVEFRICSSQLHVPDAFTPNGDGRNDYFTVFGAGITDYEIRIYNRWGELVYQSKDVSELNDLSRGWDGVYKGKTQSTATFAYYITATGFDGKSLEQKGNLTLIR